MIETLGEFDRQVAKELFALHPEWEAFAHAEDDNGEIALIVSLVPPNPAVRWPLEISTVDQEVTVFFDAYHAHFLSLDDEAIVLIEKIMSDRYSVVSFWRDDQWCGSHLYENSERPCSNEEHPHANKIVFRTWSGAQDQELSCTGCD